MPSSTTGGLRFRQTIGPTEEDLITDSEKKKLLRTNTIYWLAAMAVPLILHFGLQLLATGPVNFPWPIVVPLLLVGLLMASNKLLSEAIGTTVERSAA